MIDIKDKKSCCGCGACVQACPVNCISFKDDTEGFWYPVADAGSCVLCGLCEKVCPVIKHSGNKARGYMEFNVMAFGGRQKDEKIRADSSSGGAFSLFAQAVINEGGYVFGAALDANLNAVHICARDENGLAKLRGSKYVQSSTANTYSEIKKLLTENKKVLFSGTPCQCAGLEAFLDGAPDNLLTVDFICHGVPSPKLFADYIADIEDRSRRKIISFKFRNKLHGWNQSGLQPGTYYELSDGSKTYNYPAYNDAFMNAFLCDIALRPSCYACAFKSLPKSYADITIADFWGVNKLNKELNDGKGTSLVLVNTQKGREFWNKVNGGFNYSEVDVLKAARRNKSLSYSAQMPVNRRKFFEDYADKGYGYVKKKYMRSIDWVGVKAKGFIKSIFKKSEQFIKFGAVGITNTLVSLTVYYFCRFLGVYYLLAYLLGFLIATLNSFIWNSRFVFKNKKEKSKLKAVLKTYASYGFTFLFSSAVMYFNVSVLHISSFLAPLVTLVITVPLNFVLNKYWAFKDVK